MSALRPAAALFLALCMPLAVLHAEEAPPRPVVSEIVTGSAMTARLFPGVIAATVETTLAFQTAGRIATRPVDLGDSVETGAVLATLDQVTLAEDVAAAEAGRNAARAEAEFAAQSLARAEELHRRGVAPKATLEAAQAKDISARAAVEAAEADLARARDAAHYGTLTAPAAGIVSRILAEPGTVVSAGTPVLRLATEAGREAVIDVPDDVLAVLPEAAPFSIAARYEDALVTEGRLRLVEPVADPSTRAHRLRITLADEGQGFRLGALVSARLELPRATLLTVPLAAIWGPEAQPMVWRLDAERRARPAPVTLGQQIGPRVVITSGLAEGDEVVIRGIHSLTEGQRLGARVDP
ncbi:efflux RND transporter periplasmic adaptor subunit [Rhodobacter lacus]|uniref:Efflux RND transporter periplasmic adaptor subunit n=1 Tax=Rhodobacter lacus TaxID=1641972 RepID=A0ABW5A6Q4_9RHOB